MISTSEPLDKRQTMLLSKKWNCGCLVKKNNPQQQQQQTLIQCEVTCLMKCVYYWPKPVEFSVVVKPVRKCAVAIQGEALVEHMKGNVLKSVVVQRHL